MVCPCSDNKKLIDNKKLDNIKKVYDSKILSLEDMKNKSIDEIVNLYKNGYTVEDTSKTLQAQTSKIESLSYVNQCTGYPTLDLFRPKNQTGGITIMKGHAAAQKITPRSRCLDFMVLYDVRRLANFDMHFELREDAGGYPSGAPTTSTGRLADILVTSGNIPTNYGPLSVDFLTILPAANVPYWIIAYSSDYLCNPAYVVQGQGYERIELSYSYTTNLERTYYTLQPCQWQSKITDAWAMDVFILTYVEPSNAHVFNACWGSGLGSTCNQPPERPAILSGTTFPIKADIANQGTAGKVRAVFRANGNVITGGDQQNPNLSPFPGGGLWSPTVNYTMPSQNVNLVIDGYGWDGAGWILTDTMSAIISSTPACQNINLTPYSASIDLGQSVTLTATVIPSTQVFTVNFRLVEFDISLGTRQTSGGTCQFIWNTGNTPNLVAGTTYHVIAEIIGQCQSTIPGSGITVSTPIQQSRLDVTVANVNTFENLAGASVTVSATGPPSGTQTALTDTFGFVQFIVTHGTITVTASKTGYNTSTVYDSIYSIKSLIIYLAPTTQLPGSLRFVTVPGGAEVFFDTTSKGITNATTGILQIDNLPAGQVVNYTVKKTGYNDSSGTVTVQSDTVVNVPVTLTTVTPTTGNVCIKSNPSGASIKIGGVTQAGKSTAMSGGGCIASNIIYNLTPTLRNYELSLIGFENKTGQFTPIVGTTIEVDAGNLTPSQTMGNVTITSAPAGARIYIDNVDSQFMTPATIPNIVQGLHTYKLILAGFKDATDSFTIIAGQTIVVPNVILVEAFGSLKFLSTPVGADIFIGGISKGTTTISGLTVSNLLTGLTEFIARLTNYDDYHGTATVEEDIIKDVSITLIPSTTNKGSLRIESSPPGAEIFIDNIDKQLVTPQTFTGMDPGNHSYTLRLTGYQIVGGTFSINVGETTTITKTLQSTTGGGGGGSGVLVGLLGIGAFAMMLSSKQSSPTIPPRNINK